MFGGFAFRRGRSARPPSLRTVTLAAAVPANLTVVRSLLRRREENEAEGLAILSVEMPTAFKFNP